MIKEQQKRFYTNLGKLLTKKRHDSNMSVADLTRKSGEQNRTLRQIERGNLCSLHHITWMKETFDLSWEDIINCMEGDSDKKERTIDDLI